MDQIIFHSAGPSRPTPFQLPPVPRSFSNRSDEIRQLDAWLADSTDRPLFVVISGAAGVGKTSLALHWLHRIRNRYPDGQLHVDLNAFAPTGPVDPGEVLGWFLLALGTSEERIPADPTQRAAMYRTLMADRAAIILLDNAFSAAQVRPLLPGASRSVVLVTSRWRMTGLHMDGAHLLHTEPMNVEDSVCLLNDIVGEHRLVEQRQEAEELARLCGGLPIALTLVGARLSARPHRTLSREVGQLRREDRLAALSLRDELSVEVVFDAAYEALPAEQARLYRVCSLHPDAAFGVDVAVAMADQPALEVEDALDGLVERNLLTEIDDRRFRYHDLLLLHARQRAGRTEDASARDAITRRMVEWYLDTAVAADLVLRPTRRRIGPRFRRPADRSSVFRAARETLGWLGRERRNIVHAVRAADENGWDELVWQFCEAMWACFLHARNYGDFLEIHERGIPAARRCGSGQAEAQLRNQLGMALTSLRRYDDAIREHRTAFRLAEQAADEFLKASALSEVAGAAQGKGDLDGALRYLGRAKEIREVIGTARSLALCHRRIGEVLAEIGDYPAAVAELRLAAEAMSSLDKAQEVRALTSLGSTYVRWGRLADAEKPLGTALAMSTESGFVHYRAAVLTALGELAERGGDRDTARRHYVEAERIFAVGGDPRAEDLTERLSRLTAG